MNYKEIIETYRELDCKIECCKSLARANFNEETTYVMIEKHKGDSQGNKQRLAFLHDALVKEKSILTAELQQINEVFNDKEAEIFMESIVKRKDLRETADKMGISYGYARALQSEIKKKLDYNEKKGNEDAN